MTGLHFRLEHGFDDEDRDEDEHDEIVGDFARWWMLVGDRRCE